ncbi:prolipoprotein diacylglyceryl transferase, partial [Patescibacteria group bacterium]|nr:prolipoprotein diacylglyceryl transferase [Patescibacteria group bacterium]
ESAGRLQRDQRKILCVMCYMFLYSALRFSLEFIRIDITPVIFNLRFPQIISLLIILISILFCANYFKTDIIDP